MVQVYHRPGPCASQTSVTTPLTEPPPACHIENMGNKGNEMKVYAVMGGISYEGECGYSLRLFDCKTAADAYAKELEDGDFDYAEVKVLNVIEGSAIAA